MIANETFLQKRQNDFEIGWQKVEEKMTKQQTHPNNNLDAFTTSLISNVCAYNID